MKVRELEVRYRGPKLVFSGRVLSSRNIDTFARDKLKMAMLPYEHFYTLAMNAKNEVIGYTLVSKGGVSACAVTMADVFRALVIVNAVSFVALHNHPSGEPSPSPEDIILTERIGKAAELLGLRFTDHIIIGDPEYFSFLDAGMLELP